MLPFDAPHQSFLPAFLPELTDHVMELMDGDDLLRIRQLNTVAETYVAATIHIRARGLFANTIDDYPAFMATMDIAGAVVGGAAATHILFPCQFSPPTHLKIYTPHDTYHTVVNHLESKEGFRGNAVPLNTNPVDVAPEGVADIWRLVSHTVTIDVVQSTNRCAILPIASESHSALFNYVGTRSYCSAYPSLNRRRQSLLNPARLVDRTTIPDCIREELDPWSNAQWTLQLEWEPWAPGGHCSGVETAGCPASIRSFGDRHSFTGCSLPLRGRCITPRADAVHRLTAVWWRGGYTCGPQCQSGQVLLAPETRMCLRAVIRI